MRRNIVYAAVLSMILIACQQAQTDSDAHAANTKRTSDAISAAHRDIIHLPNPAMRPKSSTCTMLGCARRADSSASLRKAFTNLRSLAK